MMRPILFSGPMVRAILDGRKTQTRRVIKSYPDMQGWRGEPLQYFSAFGTWGYPANSGLIKCPYGIPGDRLWVRETWACVGLGKYVHRATDVFPDIKKITKRGWRPSIHMRREVSRITLEVIQVRVERLQDISENDARAEGIQEFKVGYPRSTGMPFEGYDTEYGVTNWIPTNGPTAVNAYKRLWNSINGERGYTWNSNPWIWVISFKKVPHE